MFQDHIMHCAEDVLKQNNVMLRTFVQQNSVERHESIALASRGSDTMPLFDKPLLNQTSGEEIMKITTESGAENDFERKSSPPTRKMSQKNNHTA